MATLECAAGGKAGGTSVVAGAGDKSVQPGILSGEARTCPACFGTTHVYFGNWRLCDDPACQGLVRGSDPFAPRWRAYCSCGWHNDAYENVRAATSARVHESLQAGHHADLAPIPRAS